MRLNEKNIRKKNTLKFCINHILVILTSFALFNLLNSQTACYFDEYLLEVSKQCKKCSNIIPNCMKCISTDFNRDTIDCLECPTYATPKLNADGKIIDCVPDCNYDVTLKNYIDAYSFSDCQIKKWTMEHYGYNLNDIRHGAFIRQTTNQEREALIQFYIDLNGDLWFNNDNWLIGDPCENSWFGVTCNLRGNIISLHFNMNGLRGIISDKILELIYLETLIIINTANDPLNANKNLIYRIPRSMRNWNSLTELTLRDVNLKIIDLVVPDLINKNLEILDLSFNQLSGKIKIPTEYADDWKMNRSNNKLKLLDLSTNLFQAPIDEIFIYPKSLQVIKLQNNLFYGTYPYLEDHQQLKVLDLRNNTLTGEIDLRFFNSDKFKSLEYLGFLFNNITSPLPCKKAPICLKRVFKNLKTINDINLKLTEEELSYLQS